MADKSKEGYQQLFIFQLPGALSKVSDLHLVADKNINVAR
jgi:hypothetical protein